MEINKRLVEIDPSRGSVYQMLDYVQAETQIKLIQQETENLFLFKTALYIDSLYNYAHVLGDKFGTDDLEKIKKFFGGDNFRVKTLADKIFADILLNDGFTLRDSGYAMRATGLKNLNIDYCLPSGVKIEAVTTDLAWEHFRAIFSEAFDKTTDEFDKKFGFLKKFVLDQQEKHLNFFLLYENGVPVSSGGYYAFNNFSIENIGTLKIARGRGYAGLMVRFLLNEARLLGYDSACLVGSEEAVAIYQKAGLEILSKTNTFINF
ncbi:MAG: GNAT family N-acetyltransferase [Patescibacteria group bacterium]